MARFLILGFFFLIIQYNSAVLDIKTVSLQSTIGEPLVVNVESPKKKIVHCYIRRPNDDIFLKINDTKLQSELKYTGERNDSCSFKILNVTSDHVGKWQVDTFYRGHEKIGYKVQKSSLIYYINGQEKKTFSADIGDFLIIKSMSRNKTKVQCFIHRPASVQYIDLTKLQNSTDFDYLGAIDDSCTFKIKSITFSSFGDWELLSVYNPQDGSKKYSNVLSFKITGKSSLFSEGQVSFSGGIGKPLILTLRSLNIPRLHCAYRRPLDSDFSYIGDKEWGEKFEFIGADNNSCSFVIKNLTDELIGNWELVTSYKIEEKNKPMRIEKKVTNFVINGVEEKSFTVDVGGSITLRAVAREDAELECIIYGPHDPIYLPLMDKKWKSKIEIIDEQSCSFKFINVKNDVLGEWILTKIYTSKFGYGAFSKHFIFTLTGKMKASISAKPGESLIVNSPSPKGKIKKCWFLRPSGFPYLTVNDNEWKSNFEYIGDHDNSCSFKILCMAVGSFGRWNILIEYKPHGADETIFQRESFDILKDVQENNYIADIVDKINQTLSLNRIFYEVIATHAYNLMD